MSESPATDNITPRTIFYFTRHDKNDSQPTGWYVYPGLDCLDGDGPFSSKELAECFADEAEGYLRDVFGCTLSDLRLPTWKLTLDCIRENANGGYPLDLAILQAIGLAATAECES